MSKEKTNIIKLLAERGTKVKITTIRDWVPLCKMSGKEVELIWLINRMLAVRRIIWMYITLFLLGAGIGCFFLRGIGPGALDTAFLVGGIVLSIIAAILTFMSDNWNKQLAGFRYFSNFHRLPSFGVFGYIARIIAFMFFIIWIVVIILIKIFTESIDGFTTPYKKLGLPAYSGYDDIIEQGTEYENAVKAASSAVLAKLGAKVDYSITSLQVKTEYNAIKKSIEDVTQKIVEIDRPDYELTDQEKVKLDMLKSEVLKSQQLLDEKYKDESDYESIKNAFVSINKKLDKMTSDDYCLSESDKNSLKSISEKNDTAQQKLENSYLAKKSALQQEHNETIAKIDRQYGIDNNNEEK